MKNALPLLEPPIDLGPDMQIALLAAQKAGLKIQEAYGKMHDIEEKGVGDLVSQVDKECDQEIQNILREKRPVDDILSEELCSGTVDQGQRLWVIDPLDATSGFLFEAGKDITSVMIALREEMETTLGVILFPLTGDYYYAKKKMGAFRNNQQIDTLQPQLII